MSSVTEQVHDNGTLADSLVDFEQVLARNPAILLSLLPRSSVLSYTNDDVQAVVAKVETLAVTLRTVTDEGESVVFKEVLSNMELVVCSADC